MTRLFTQKHYIEIARLIKVNNAQKELLTLTLIKAFIMDSDKFDLAKFNRAISKQ